jgi:hypothetical protein
MGDLAQFETDMTLFGEQPGVRGHRMRGHHSPGKPSPSSACRHLGWVCLYVSGFQHHILLPIPSPSESVLGSSLVQPALALSSAYPAPSQRRHSDSRSSSGVAHRPPPTCSTLTLTFLPLAPCLPSLRHSTTVPVRLHPSLPPWRGLLRSIRREPIVSDLPASLQTMSPTHGPPVSRRVP